MAQNFIQEGNTLTITAGADITSGSPVKVGNIVGIALGDIANGATGQIKIKGVFELPKKASLAISEGDVCHWDASPGEVTKTQGDGYFLGFAVEAAAGDDTVVKVLLVQASPLDAGQAAVVTAIGAPTAVTGVDGTGSNAASKADVDTRLTAIHTKIDAILTALKNAELMASA